MKKEDDVMLYLLLINALFVFVFAYYFPIVTQEDRLYFLAALLVPMVPVALIYKFFRELSKKRE